MLRECIDSMFRAWIRFWDNRFTIDSHLEFYRLTIERLELANKRLTEQIIELAAPKTQPEREINPADMVPMQKRVPFSVRRRELEQASAKRMMELKSERELKLVVATHSVDGVPIVSDRQSVEDLEAELGLDNATI